MIEDSHVVKVEVGLTMYVACLQAVKDGCKVIYSGLGSEEVFAGYQRHRESSDINQECIKGLLGLHERDLYRDDVLTINAGLELRTPFLDKELIEFGLKIPGKYKIYQGREKYILRLAAAELGVMKEVCERKKKAAQYGSNVDKMLKKIVIKKKMGRKEYFRSFYHGLKLGALVSSGKDSLYAMHLMEKQGYKIECLISLTSENTASYMFHSPNIHLVEMQAECLEIPLMRFMTKGEKEKELKDLEDALKAAKEKYGIQGVTTGALFSDYQRERVEKICKKLKLKCFSPLWHKNQETELREIIDSGFEIILSAVAAEGLDKSWLGRKITHKDVDKLVAINKKIGINVAFEGGEAESLVLDAPMFKKKIKIEDSSIVMERENTGLFVVKKAKIAEKGYKMR
jgi:asparagine synthase (glutamine-hydrolysing)